MRPLSMSRACPKPAVEITFNSIVEGLFNERGIVPDGNILDVGSKDGKWACMYGCWQPHRTVRAVDPSQVMLDNMQKFCKASPNVHRYLGAVSNVSGLLHAPKEQKSAIERGEFSPSSMSLRPGGRAPSHQGNGDVIPVYTIDSLFEQACTCTYHAHHSRLRPCDAHVFNPAARGSGADQLLALRTWTWRVTSVRHSLACALPWDEAGR